MDVTTRKRPTVSEVEVVNTTMWTLEQQLRSLESRYGGAMSAERANRAVVARRDARALLRKGMAHLPAADDYISSKTIPSLLLLLNAGGALQRILREGRDRKTRIKTALGVITLLDENGHLNDGTIAFELNSRRECVGQRRQPIRWAPTCSCVCTRLCSCTITSIATPLTTFRFRNTCLGISATRRPERAPWACESTVDLHRVQGEQPVAQGQVRQRHLLPRPGCAEGSRSFVRSVERVVWRQSSKNPSLGSSTRTRCTLRIKTAIPPGGRNYLNVNAKRVGEGAIR